jgi:FKBP-type peptidyl-prolyl cis-trans isomerase
MMTKQYYDNLLTDIKKKVLWWASLLGVLALLFILRHIVQTRHYHEREFTRRIARQVRASEHVRLSAHGLSNGAIYEDIVIGTGLVVKNGDRVRMHYDVTLTNGDNVDSSYEKGKPFEFTIGMGKDIITIETGEVIKGWDTGVLGMRVGGRRVLTIPSELACDEASGGEVIPLGSALVFDIDVLGTTPQKP